MQLTDEQYNDVVANVKKQMSVLTEAEANKPWVKKIFSDLENKTEDGVRYAESWHELDSEKKLAVEKMSKLDTKECEALIAAAIADIKSWIALLPPDEANKPWVQEVLSNIENRTKEGIRFAEVWNKFD